MKAISILLVLGSAAALAGCNATTSGGTQIQYVKYMQGPPIEYAQAQCNLMSAQAEQGYVAYGSAGYVAGAAIGNAIGNAIRRAQYFENCMVMQGYKKMAVQVAPTVAPTPPPPASAKPIKVVKPNGKAA